MVDIDRQIKNIQEKLQQLSRQQQLLHRENQKLKKDLGKSHAALQEKELTIQRLQQQVDVLKLGSPSQTAEEKSALEKRIDMYLKEIDKCLVLLNE